MDTGYHSLTVAAIRRGGRPIDNAALACIWPALHDNVKAGDFGTLLGSPMTPTIPTAVLAAGYLSFRRWAC